MKVYVLSEIGYEYDDQYYSVAGSNYGSTFVEPVKVFTKEEKAKESLKSQTIDYLRKHFMNAYNNLGHWAQEDEGWESIFKNQSKAIKFWKHEFDIELNEDRSWDIPIPSGVSDEQLGRLYDLLSIKFFNITEVDIDG